jgi:sigma-E factor negative regulatory protein RseC
MSNQSTITHDGIIESVSGTNVRVRFVAHSACSACHAKGVCSASDTEDKVVDVQSDLKGWSAGDRVQVLLAQRLGFRAVWIGYGIPLIILLAVVFTVYGLTGRDGLSALIGLGVLAPYYALVFAFRKRITRSMEFRLQKTIDE